MRETESAREQEDVLPKKGHALKSDRGLQQWGDDPAGAPGGGSGTGTGGMGTADRAARIAAGQKKQIEEGAERDA